tara:strand:- start:1669 stop:2070 length:402 start_codon:yes stop_codon:yes gene_type:complete
MIDRHLIVSKADKVYNCLKRIHEKRSVTLNEFISDLDRQESILFNLQMAIQNCIDIAAHIVSDEELGVAGSTNEMFYMLQENGYLSLDLTERMVAAVGFRNLVVHEYEVVDLKRVYQIVQQDIFALKQYSKSA